MDRNTIAAISLALILLVTASCVEARIGDTEAQIETRYGPALATKDGYIARHTRRFYDFKNYGIEVDYVDGKSAVEYFRTKDHSPLSATETNASQRLLSEPRLSIVLRRCAHYSM